MECKHWRRDKNLTCFTCMLCCRYYEDGWEGAICYTDRGCNSETCKGQLSGNEASSRGICESCFLKEYVVTKKEKSPWYNHWTNEVHAIKKLPTAKNTKNARNK